MAVYEGEAGVKKANTSLISLSQIADGERIARCLDIVENLNKNQDLSLYRLKEDKLGLNDFDDTVLNLVTKGYDDTFIKGKIGILESVINEKADKCDLSLYRRETDLITRHDLDDDLIKMIKSGDYDYYYDDTEIRKMIESLQMCKTETSESGFIKDLNPNFTEILNKKYNSANMVTALNFLFNFVNYYTSESYGNITEVHDENLDMGYIRVLEPEAYYDFGSLLPKSSLSI